MVLYQSVHIIIRKQTAMQLLVQNGNYSIRKFHPYYDYNNYKLFVFRLVSPSNIDKKREFTERKVSFTDDNRANVNPVNTKKSNTDNASKPPGSKSLLFVFMRINSM